MFQKLTVAVILLAGLILSSCGDDRQTLTEAQEQVIEIKIDGHTIKAAIGQGGSLQMPTWVPDDFQLPEGSSIYMATEDIASGGGILGVSLTMTSEHSIKYFSNTFANDGWSISDDSVGFPQVTYIRGKMHVIANVNVDRKNKDLSQITLFFFVEQK